MTDRERLLELVRVQERRAQNDTRVAVRFMDRSISGVDDGSDGIAFGYARAAAHHALTALALRDCIEDADFFRLLSP